MVLAATNQGLKMYQMTDRLTKEDLAKRLKASPDGVAYLVHKKLLKPCGKPGGTKKLFFPTEFTLNLLKDPRVLDEITNALYDYSAKKHLKAKNRKNGSSGPDIAEGSV